MSDSSVKLAFKTSIPQVNHTVIAEQLASVEV